MTGIGLCMISISTFYVCLFQISSSNTKIATLLGKGRVKDSSDELPTDDKIKLTEQKAMLDEERNKMIVEYRKLKHRKTLSKLRSLHPLQT